MKYYSETDVKEMIDYAIAYGTDITNYCPSLNDYPSIELGWHTGTPTETGEYLVCIKYDFGEKGYTTANYVEPFNPHGGWYSLKPPSAVSAEEWCKKHGIKVIAWQKIEPYKETSE